MSLIEACFVIASKEPKKLAKFYAQVNDVKTYIEIEFDYYEVILQNGLKLKIYKPSIKQSFSIADRRFSSICFLKSPSTDPLSELKQWSSKITKYGAKIESDLKLKTFGAEAWVSDLDRNNFLILVPSISWKNNL